LHYREISEENLGLSTKPFNYHTPIDSARVEERVLARSVRTRMAKVVRRRCRRARWSPHRWRTCRSHSENGWPQSDSIAQAPPCPVSRP